MHSSNDPDPEALVDPEGTFASSGSEAKDPPPAGGGWAGILRGRVLGGRYRLKDVLGGGGMGVVCRAEDLAARRDIALKMISAFHLPPDKLQNYRRRFAREAEAMRRCTHCRVARLLDFGTDPETGLDYLVTELLEGVALSELLKQRGRLGPVEAMGRALQMAEALSAVHDAGMVHRDLKPSNFFVIPCDRPSHYKYNPEDPSGIRLLDFGIAQISASDGTLTHLTGWGGAPHTPLYASPEQRQGRATLTPASDIFSLGLIVLEMLTGRPPRRGPDGAIPLPALPIANVQIRHRIEALLGRATALEAAERIATAGELHRAIDESLRMNRMMGYIDHVQNLVGQFETIVAPSDETEWDTRVNGYDADGEQERCSVYYHEGRCTISWYKSYAEIGSTKQRIERNLDRLAGIPHGGSVTTKDHYLCYEAIYDDFYDLDAFEGFVVRTRVLWQEIQNALKAEPARVND